jgi:hypothetical protein
LIIIAGAPLRETDYSLEVLFWAITHQVITGSSPRLSFTAWLSFCLPKFVTGLPNSAIFAVTSETSLVFAVAASEEAM